MTITELIAALEKIRDEQGDIPVIVSVDDWGGSTLVREESMQIDLWPDGSGRYGTALNIHWM